MKLAPLLLLAVLGCSAAQEWPPATMNATWPDRWFSSWIQYLHEDFSSPMMMAGSFYYDWPNRMAVMTHNKCLPMGTNSSCAFFFTSETIYVNIPANNYTCKCGVSLPISPPDWVYGINAKDAGPSTYMGFESNKWVSNNVGALQYDAYNSNYQNQALFSAPLGVDRFGAYAAWLTPVVLVRDDGFPNNGEMLEMPHDVLASNVTCPFPASLEASVKTAAAVTNTPLSFLHVHDLVTETLKAQ